MFKSRLPMIAAEIAPRVDAAVAAAAEAIAIQAKSRVPVDTGKLRNAIHVEHTGHGEYAVIAGTDEVFYGHIVEHGGAHTPAHPFMIPALEGSRDEILKLATFALRSL